MTDQYSLGLVTIPDGWPVELSVEGLSIVHGNCSLERATANALSVLELANASHMPVAKGCTLPLVQPSLLAPETHGETGLGYAKLPAPRSKPIGQHGVDFLVEKGDPLDKAGAYAVQAQAALFIEGIEGDYWNVVGLPISLIYRLAGELG